MAPSDHLDYMDVNPAPAAARQLLEDLKSAGASRLAIKAAEVAVTRNEREAEEAAESQSTGSESGAR